MKSFLGVVTVFLITFNMIKSLFTPDQIQACEGFNTNGTDLSKWEAKDCDFGSPDDNSGYKCCLVKYKFHNKGEARKCYLVKNTEQAIRDYKEHALGYFDKITVKCGSSYFMTVGFFFLVFLLFF